MASGGKRSTTWKPGNGPGKPKGAKNESTKIKEAIGVENWDQLKEFMETKGAEKFKKELMTLTGVKFTIAYLQFAEFIRPKLARTTLAGDPDNPLQLAMIELATPSDAKETEFPSQEQEVTA